MMAVGRETDRILQKCKKRILVLSIVRASVLQSGTLSGTYRGGLHPVLFIVRGVKSFGKKAKRPPLGVFLGVFVFFD